MHWCWILISDSVPTDRLHMTACTTSINSGWIIFYKAFKWSRNGSQPYIRNDCQKIHDCWGNHTARHLRSHVVAHITSSWTNIFRKTSIQFTSEANWKRKLILNLLSWEAEVRSSDFWISSSPSALIFTFTKRHHLYVGLTFTLAVTQECSIKTRERQCSSTKSDRLTPTWKIGLKYGGR